MRGAGLLVTVALGSMLSACSYAPLAAALPKEDEVTVLATEDGAKYIHVASARNAPQSHLRGRWKREARKSCHGDYVVIDEDQTERRTDNRVRGRTHAGYVRCVDPEPSLEDAAGSDTKPRGGFRS